MNLTSSTLTDGKLAAYCNRRLAPIFAPDELTILRDYLYDLLERNEYPPYRASGLDLQSLSAMLDIDVDRFRAHRATLQPIFDAVAREVSNATLRPDRAGGRSTRSMSSGPAINPTGVRASSAEKVRKRRGVQPRAAVEFPEPIDKTWQDPATFGEALQLHARRHGETIYHLYNAVVRPEDGVNRSTLISWGRGKKVPRAAISLEILGRIERRYRLSAGYFLSLSGTPGRAPGDFDLDDISPSERRRLAWHLPEDFNRRPSQEKAEILNWVRTVIISGSTDYRRYLHWRERRRGFYTKWEIDLLSIAAAICREETGWLRQSPRMGSSLRPIEGLVSEADINAVQSDWPAACDRMYKHARRRIKEIDRVARVHRDPFEPILSVLEAPSPVGEYRKITEEILRRMPEERHNARAAAEAVRAFLMLRIGLHTGLRQKNLRELMLCRPGTLPTSERKLEDLKRGELRWSSRDQGWEILIPSVAFKNANSSFFGSKPFRLILPDLGRLYELIEAWIERHRARLIGEAVDPGTFFVKTAKMTSANAAYCQNTFYEAWRTAIQRYGIYNPWTKRGAIEGLLPHWPHNLRDVLATHILKRTGSYEQASYAIQDTSDMVARHYGRFLPQDKSEIAARILNQVWQAA